MTPIFWICLFLLTAHNSNVVNSQNIRPLGSFDMRRPGFTEIFTHTDPADDTEQFSFLVSTFNPIPGTTDEVFFVRYPGKYLDDPSVTPYEIVGEDYTWPREPSHIPGMVYILEYIFFL